MSSVLDGVRLLPGRPITAGCLWLTRHFTYEGRRLEVGDDPTDVEFTRRYPSLAASLDLGTQIEFLTGTIRCEDGLYLVHEPGEALVYLAGSGDADGIALDRGWYYVAL